MTEWLVDIHNLIPQGQLVEFLTIARVDRVTGECEVVQASMLKCGYHGEFLIPQADSPFAAFGAAAVESRSLHALLQAIMDCAWKRGLRPSKFDPSAGELAAVQAHLADMRRIALDAGKTVPDVTGDIGAGEGAKG